MEKKIHHEGHEEHEEKCCARMRAKKLCDLRVLRGEFFFFSVAL
jgi:hypothetical protein